MTDEITTRLQRSTSEVSLADEVKAAHLSAISDALANAPVVPLDPVSRRRRVIAAVTAAALIGPAGLAAASGDALPGEPLYGVKQVSEQVTSLFDPEVIARHRIEEAEALAMLGQRSEAAITRAADAVAGLPEDHALRHRLAALAADRDDDSEQHRDRDRAAQPDHDDGDDGATDDGATDDDIDDNVTEDAGQPNGDDDIDNDSDDSDVDFDDEPDRGVDGDDVTEDAGQPEGDDDIDDNSDAAGDGDDSDSADDD